MFMLVLAGGFGTRLTEVVSDVPKAMAPINGKPLLKLQLDNWIEQGQRDFVFLLHYQADIIIRFLEEQLDMLNDKINISWIIEESVLGTGGSVANAINQLQLSNSVLITNADTWLDSGLKEISRFNNASLGTVEVTNSSRYGSIKFNNKGLITEFIEKKDGFGSSGAINAGLYKLPTNIFKEVPSKEVSLEKEILPNLVKKGELFATKLNTNFFDIGVPDDYFRFCEWHKNLNKCNE